MMTQVNNFTQNSSMNHRYVIIGGNIAGTTLAESLRKSQPDASITIIERETNPCYSRVLLPHYVKNKIPREKLFMKQMAWYEEHNVEYMNGVEALSIDAQNRFVATSEGREIPYDTLVITTGGDVNTLPFSQREITYFRGVEDADQIKTLISELKLRPEEERHMLIYGGGFITMEFANMCEHYGLKGTIVMRSPGFWSKALTEEASNLLANHSKSKGVEVHFGTEIRLVLGGDHVEGVLLENGEEIPAKMIGAGIGIHTERPLLEGVGLEVASGIKVNNFFETGVENIYAIGDIAEFEDIIVKRQLSYGNWMNAQMQARVLAKTLSGEKTPFELVSSYATNLLGKEIVFIGDVSIEHSDEIRVISSDSDHYVAVYDRGEQTVGAVLIGEVTKRAMITKSIKEQTRYE